MPSRIRYQRYRDFDGLARGRLTHTKDAIDAAGVIVDTTMVTHAVASFTNASNLFTITGVDGIADGTPVMFHNLGGALPAELSEATVYYTNDAGTNTYTLHLTKAAAVAGTGTVAITDDGTGTTEVYLINEGLAPLANS